MQLIRVVLPEPFGPMMPSRSPARSVKVDALQRLDGPEALLDAGRGDDGLSHGGPA